MMKCSLRWLVLFALLLAGSALAQRQMEHLGRGVVAVRTGTSSVYVGWRLLGNDPDDVGFNLYRSANGGVAVKLNGSPLATSCNFNDSTANLAQVNAYFVRPVIAGIEGAPSTAFTLPANAPTQQLLNVPLQRPPGGTSYDGVNYTYAANDCSVGDVDGDGEYEIILKWDPSNSKDNSQSGFTGNVLLDCYRLDGTRLWRIDLGPNVRAGAHYTQFMVYDFDGDGRAELMCRTAPGARDGLGNYVGSATRWQDANGPRPSFSNTDDYRFNNPNGTANGYILAGPEFITVFRGLTGEELASATYYPKRDPDNNNDNPTASRINSVWGDSYGNRLDRFLAGVAYVDGVRPSAIFCRGYYTRAYLAAWDWRDGLLTRRWTFSSNPSNLSYRGQGAHSLTIGDVDGDGKDEITYGAAAIDDNGQGLYSTGLGHGDALHLSDMDPSRPGQEVWMVHEDPGSYGAAGLEFRDAQSGALIFGVDGQGSDVGRGVAYDIDPRHGGYEMWGSRGGLMSAAGSQIGSSKPPQNFCVWWDADLLRESLDGTTISKWNWNNNSSSSVQAPGGISSNNGTKATPGLSADLFGDWREEVIWRTSDNLNLRIYTTTVLTTNRLPTLMHDPQYRVAIAWQNTGYNQPPHPGFFLGQDMFPPPRMPVSDADLVWRGGGGNIWDVATANWRTNGLWVSNDTAVAFVNGRSVLFDLSGSNNSSITLTGTMTPAAVMVHAAKDFVFAGDGALSGDMKLVKAGPGRLTVNNTNTYSGETRVAGGALFVNGSLEHSHVIVERRGTPEGPSQFGGSGRVGGLTIQNGCVLIVGPATNSPGTLTISNQFTQLGVRNRFDLSNDPTGNTNANDRVNVFGNVTLAGTNIIEVNQLNGFLGNGVYPLITYSGTLMGGLNNLALAGDFIQPVALTNRPGMIGLLAVLPAAPPAAPLNLSAVAVGAFQINLSWTDVSTNEIVQVLERSTNNTVFSQIANLPPDAENFQDVGLLPGTTYYYRLRGTNLVGASDFSNTANATTAATPPALTWRGDGTQNVWDLAVTANWRQGGNPALYANGALVTFDNSGSNSPSIVLADAIAPGSLTVNASKNYTFGGNGGLQGGTSLVKAGTGTLTLNTTNTFTGGVIISNGVVLPGSASANSVALGSGPITFYGGILEFNGWNGSTSPDYGGNASSLIVPAGQTGTIRVPQRFVSPGLSGALTGGGTLNLQVKYVRGEIIGNWSGFTGRINVTRGSSGATVEDFRVGNAAGFPNARLSLGTNVIMYSRVANATIPIGEFSANQGAIVSASGGSALNTQYAVTWRVGGLNTHATNNALFQTATSLIKEGTGRWTLMRDNTYTGTTTINAGTLHVNGDQSAATGAVTVNAGGTLGGVGVIGGNTTIDGTLSPGVSIGTLSFSQDLTLTPGSRSRFEISKNPFGHDRVVVGDTLALAGRLEVVNTSVELLEAGDSFPLFSAGSMAGGFATMNLPELDDGLAWNTSRLATQGTLWVVNIQPPILNHSALANDQFTVSGYGGTPNWNYFVLTATNPASPLAHWIRVATNQFDVQGNFNFTAPLSASEVQRYYRIQVE